MSTRAFRGAGLAQALFAEALTFAEQGGFAEMMLWSDTRFVRGHRFYEKLGFRRWPGERYLADVSATWEYHFRKPFLPRRLPRHDLSLVALRAALGIALLTAMDAVIKGQMHEHPVRAGAVHALPDGRALRPDRAGDRTAGPADQGEPRRQSRRAFRWWS